MAGHSKWQNIKRKKEANDAKRSKVFSKMSRLITVAAKKGGGDPDTNPALRLAIEKAKYNDMPKDNINRAIQKGVGGLEGSDFVELTYEGYGPAGVGYMLSILTDNRNRTAAEIKNIFSKYGGSLGEPGSTAYIFEGNDNEPSFTIEAEDKDLERNQKLQDELEDHDDVQEIYSNLKL